MCIYAYKKFFCNIVIFSSYKIIFLRVNNLFAMLNYLFSLQTKLFSDVDPFVRDIYFHYLASTINVGDV